MLSGFFYVHFRCVLVRPFKMLNNQINAQRPMFISCHSLGQVINSG
jgi:hypothetical protein